MPCGVSDTQRSLCWPDPDRFREQWLAVLTVLDEIVARVSLKEAAFVIGVSDKALGHALAERERHYPRMDWLPALCALAKQCDLTERLGSVLLAPLGLVAKSAEITDAEWRRRVEVTLATMGEVGELALKKAGVKP